MSEELKLTDREWRGFKIGSLFNVRIGRSLDGNKVSRDGQVAYITRKESNNGLDGFIEEDASMLTDEYPVITIGNETAQAFVQVYPFFTGTKVNILAPIDDAARDMYVLQFVSVSLSKHKSKYSYSYTINSTRLREQIILLPIQADSTPDWEFMSTYMKQEEERLIVSARRKQEEQLLENIVLLGALNDREWREFVFGEVFDIRSTRTGLDKKKLSGEEGEIPYITRTDNNNGIDGFIAPQCGACEDEGNVITIGLDTQTVFYQGASFYTGQNIQVVRHEQLNKYNALFIIRAIKILVQKFSWGSYGATLTRLRRGKLYLPIAADGTPDWEFMSAFMQRVEHETLSQALAFFRSKECDNMLMGGGRMLPFYIGDVLSIENGVRLTKADMREGIRPFIGASESNNGVTGFIDNTNSSLASNVLGVNYNGSVGFSFYHPYEALFSDDVKRVRWKDEEANNKYTLLYLSTAISQQKGKYAYGYKFNAQRMKRQLILLPVLDDGTLDYALMEHTMRLMEYEALRKYMSEIAV